MADRTFDRRTVLRGTGVAALAALAGCSGGGDGGGDSTPTETATPTKGSGEQSFGGWLEQVSNYDGVVDRTGTDTVTVEVGVEANGGYYGFGPAAVKVSKGTTVEWKWTGKGSSHNVVEQGGAYESKLYSESGVHFSHTFDSTGTSKYYCQPHKTLGMKGVVVVE